MRKIVLIYGGIAGLLMISMFIVSFYLMEQGTLTFANSEIFGYSTMIVVLSLIFFGVKSFRDKHNTGAMTFGKGFKVGISIAAVASLFYAGGWEIYYNSTDLKDTFMQKYTDQLLKKMEQEGKSQVEIDKKREEMNSMAEMYKNPFIRFGMTLMEIFPVGLLITLISAGLLRKKEILPA
ncbi:MAG: DUF4199 domain-containing protein [Ignavibacteriales bacterium]|nr:DUF4199 domain-containing protein [Ignavibacteriales bacterium]